MLLKISAYELMQSLVYFSGLPSSPLHQLESIRRILEPSRSESEIISLALEIIGVERATASVLRRSIPSYSRLAANRYDRSLIEDKINFLYESGMTTDCYYYLGRICSDILKSLDNTFWHTYAKLVQLGMDLSMDIEHIQRWNPQLTAAARRLLRSHRTVIAGWAISTLLLLARNFALYFRFLGLVLSLYPQQGHHNPSHLMKISQIWQRLWPLTYRPEPTGFWALCLIQIPLHVIVWPIWGSYPSI